MTEKREARRGWLTTTGTSRGTTRWDVTLTNEDGTKNDHRRGIDDPIKETKVQLAIRGPEDGGSEERGLATW